MPPTGHGRRWPSGLGKSPIGRIRRDFGLKSHQSQTFNIAGLMVMHDIHWPGAGGQTVDAIGVTLPSPAGRPCRVT